MSCLFLSNDVQKLGNHLTEKRNTRHLKLWAPPTSVYSWPQMKTAGKYNPHRYRLAVLWTHRDAKVCRQRAANERRVLLFFFVNRRLPACRLLSVHLLALRDLRHTPSLRSLIPLNNAGRIRHLPVSLSLCLSLSRLSLFQIQITSAHAKTVQPGSGSLTGQVWTKCQLFPVHPRLDTLAGASERSKGQDDNRQPGVIDLPAKYELDPSYSFRFQLYFCNISVSFLNVTLYKSFIHAGKLNRHDVNCSKFSDFL